MTDTAEAQVGGRQTRLTAHPHGPLRGVVAAPGDKSISHRALILGALARGVTEIEGLLEGDDVRRTASAMQAFGARVERLGVGRWQVEGAGRLVEPADVVDCGNAGTGARLIMGAVAGFPLSATFTGDASLRSRPMGRVLKPLGMMGVTWTGRHGDRLPLSLRGGDLRPIRYRLPEASAQVKSAILLAGLGANGETQVIEPTPTRDHTERMLRAFGAEVSVDDTPEGRVIGLRGGQPLTGAPVQVPGDPSSAAFAIVAALITYGSAVTVTRVLLNPLRIGLIETLQEMGADLTIGERAGERGRADRRHHRPPLPAARRPRPRSAGRLDDRRISDPGGGRRLRRRTDRDAGPGRAAGQGERPHRRHGRRPRRLRRRRGRRARGPDRHRLGRQSRRRLGRRRCRPTATIGSP